MARNNGKPKTSLINARIGDYERMLNGIEECEHLSTITCGNYEREADRACACWSTLRENGLLKFSHISTSETRYEKCDGRYNNFVTVVYQDSEGHTATEKQVRVLRQIYGDSNGFSEKGYYRRIPASEVYVYTINYDNVRKIEKYLAGLRAMLTD